VPPSAILRKIVYRELGLIGDSAVAQVTMSSAP
jgi:hypothetical protein